MPDTIVRSQYRKGQELPFRPDGTQCTECNRPATHRVVDGFLCNRHFASLQKEMTECRETTQFCDLCKMDRKGVRQWQDPAEGSSGRLYNACPSCIEKAVKDFIGDDELEDDDGGDIDFVVPDEPGIIDDDD